MFIDSLQLDNRGRFLQKGGSVYRTKFFWTYVDVDIGAVLSSTHSHLHFLFIFLHIVPVSIICHIFLFFLFPFLKTVHVARKSNLRYFSVKYILTHGKHRIDFSFYFLESSTQKLSKIVQEVSAVAFFWRLCMHR